LDERSWQSILIRYEGSNYRVYDLRKKRVIINKDIEINKDNIYKIIKDIQKDEAFFPWNKEDNHGFPEEDLLNEQGDISSNNDDPGEDEELGESEDLLTPDNLRLSKKLRVPEGFQPRSGTKNGGRNYRLANDIIIAYDTNDFLATVSDKFGIKTRKNVFPVPKSYIHIIRVLSSLY